MTKCWATEEAGRWYVRQNERREAHLEADDDNDDETMNRKLKYWILIYAILSGENIGRKAYIYTGEQTIILNEWRYKLQIYFCQ
jgi:hypothetical protein